MITKISLNNWKSFVKAQLFIDELSFVIGTNASGKSNILDAFSFLKELSVGATVNEAIGKVRGGEEWLFFHGTNRLSLGVEISEGEYTYTYDISLSRQQDTIFVCDESLSRQYKESEPRRFYYVNNYDTSSSRTIDTRFMTGKRGAMRRMDLNFSVSVLSQITHLPVLKDIREAADIVRKAINSIFVLTPQPADMRAYSPLANTLSATGSNVAGVLAGMDEHSQKTVEQRLTSYVKPLPDRDLDKVWAEKVGRYGSDAMLYCDEHWSDQFVLHLDARGMSDGTLRFVAIATALLTLPEHSLLVIEEVDNGLHPSRAEELVKMLRELGKERSIDVLCTTHNPVLIDALGLEMIPFISYVARDAKGGSVINLVEDLPNLAKMMAGNTVGSMMVKNEVGISKNRREEDE